MILSRFSDGLLLIPVMAAVVLSGNALATDPGFLSTGHRLFAKWDSGEYRPRIVDCDASSIGLCLRDTRYSPADNPLEPTDDGNLRVEFAEQGVQYVIHPDGSGTAFMGDNELGPFDWSLIPE